MSAAGLAAIVAIGLPALGFVLWPLLRRGPASAGLLPIPQDARDELNEEKTALYRALRELEFDYQAGHLSEDDYTALRSRYETRAARILNQLDALGPTPPRAEPSKPGRERDRRPWPQSPVGLSLGTALLVLFGVTLGLGVTRFTEPDRTVVPPGSRLPVTLEPPPTSPTDPSRALPPGMLRGMLEAAHQSLDAGRYREAIAAYQAVLKREPKNVDAITHLGVILSIAGHTEGALEAFDKAIGIDPGYAHAYWDKGRVLYEDRQDYAGAIEAWETFVALAPGGEDRDRALALIEEARRRLASAGR